VSLPQKNNTHLSILMTNQANLAQSVQDCDVVLNTGVANTTWPAERGLLARIDNSHANSKAAWQQMGSPTQPTHQQLEELESASAFELLSTPLDGPLRVSVPAHGVAALFVKMNSDGVVV